MQKNFLKSMTVWGAIVGIATYFGATEEVATLVGNILALGLVLTGRFRKGDLTIGPAGAITAIIATGLLTTSLAFAGTGNLVCSSTQQDGNYDVSEVVDNGDGSGYILFSSGEPPMLVFEDHTYPDLVWRDGHGEIVFKLWNTPSGAYDFDADGDMNYEDQGFGAQY